MSDGHMVDILANSDIEETVKLGSEVVERYEKKVFMWKNSRCLLSKTLLKNCLEEDKQVTNKKLQ